MYQIDATKFPAPADMKPVYQSKALWIAHCAGPFYYLGAPGNLIGLAQLRRERLVPYGIHQQHDPRDLVACCDEANEDPELLGAAFLHLE